VTSQEIPHKIGKYQVTRELGRGGVGVVYLARDPFIGRLVAIKTTLIPPPKDPDKFEEFQKIFFNEARAAGKLTHPHIVSVYDATVQKDGCYLVMEYVDGTTLKEYCRNKTRLPFEKLVKIIFQCAKALDYAHKNGVIHRDIKPTNILISTNGEAKISDFGIAKVEGTSEETPMDSFTGSVFYTSPEQLRNQPLTPQTDLFSLGVVMYELLTGIKPFKADTDLVTFFKITKEDPEPLKKYRGDVPEVIERIVMRALEKDLEKRYQTGLQLASELSGSFDNLRHLEEEINFEEKFNALKKLDFFKDFSSGELAELVKVTQWVKFEASDTIITEGQIEDSFYIIVVGEVTVKKKGKPLAVLKRGDCFGEMAYLGKTKRTATIESLGNTFLMKINASVIDQMSASTQLCFYKVFSNTLIRRLIRTSELFSKSSV
jgi:serine/threonine protein kinase